MISLLKDIKRERERERRGRRERMWGGSERHNIWRGRGTKKLYLRF
jgi:hypothetical protein